MRVTIRQKDVKVTDALRDYIERKIVHPAEKRLEGEGNYGEALMDIAVIRTTHHHHKGPVYAVSASITVKDGLIRAEATGEDVHAACDALEEELKREIVARKGKSLSLVKRGARAAKQYLRINPAAWFSRGTRVRGEGD